MLDVMIRRGTLDGAPIPDGRIIVLDDGRGAVIASPNGPIEATIAGTGVVASNDQGRISADFAGQILAAQVDDRCGDCGGRYAVSHVDPTPFIPTIEEAPAPAYGDTY